jgi:YjbE family integral membrane protein
MTGSDALGLGMSLIQIVWINILLSGDNAMVIALACRSLPAVQRRLGIVLGAGAAVLLRILLTAGVSQMLEIPYLKAVGGVLLVWVAIRLLLSDDPDGEAVAGHDRLWRAIWTVMVADVVMSLDNIIAIAAAAKGSTWLIGFGLALSIPLVVAGSSLIVLLIDRYPVLVWAGAGLLGWIAGDMLMADKAVAGWAANGPTATVVAAGTAVLVLVVSWTLKRRAPS